MRALGPGSVSSFLKIILDVVFFALWAGVAALILIALAALLLGSNPNLVPHVAVSIDDGQLVRRGPVLVGGLAAAGLYTVGVLAIVGALRRIFSTLTAGDPFHPENVSRLRFVGLILAGLELGRYGVWLASKWMPGVDRVEPTFGLTAWFSVLVVFVLAEVFREGARLRREAELTI